LNTSSDGPPSSCEREGLALAPALADGSLDYTMIEEDGERVVGDWFSIEYDLSYKYIVLLED